MPSQILQNVTQQRKEGKEGRKSRSFSWGSPDLATRGEERNSARLDIREGLRQGRIRLLLPFCAPQEIRQEAAYVIEEHVMENVWCTRCDWRRVCGLHAHLLLLCVSVCIVEEAVLVRCVYVLVSICEPDIRVRFGLSELSLQRGDFGLLQRSSAVRTQNRKGHCSVGLAF